MRWKGSYRVVTTSTCTAGASNDDDRKRVAVYINVKPTARLISYSYGRRRIGGVGR